ncbi:MULTISPECIES: hypothetical protein [unclassified Shewanella]|uniref:hypothetical protein n=1 Tax=unclassified Shewanella TaxID=196818 RepID=UPI0022BA4BB3|nr:MULTISPECIES: hypothetical protein [unclassified Shewanella]MEC4740015.1 hypothetical protein [Shewanella sp. E94]WBJ94371.1 hypothetical protein HWQ47_21260 [Shewanella sp. MTB7]
MNDITPDETQEIFEALPPKWEGDDLVAEVILSDRNLELIKKASVHNLVSEYVGVVGSRVKRKKLVEDFCSKNYGETVRVFFNVDIGPVRFFENFESLIETHPTEKPSSFVVTSEAEGVIYYPCETPSGRLKHYLEVHSLWSALLDKSDDDTANGLTFLYKGKLYLNGLYSASCLENGFDGLTKFLSLLQKDKPHEVEKGHILQNTLHSFLYHVETDDKFAYLLSNFSSFSLKFDEAYQAYSVGFSFDKLREEYEERYRDYMIKVNDLISASLIKSLTIPAVIFLTSTRTQAVATANSGASHDEIIAVNIGVGLVALIVSVVFSMMMISELQSIKSIKAEYESLMGRLEKKSSEAFNAIYIFRKNLRSKLIYANTVLLSLILFSIVHATISLLWVTSRTQGWAFSYPIYESVAFVCKWTRALFSVVASLFS